MLFTRRYKRWCDNRHWDYILEQLIDEPDYEWLMIDTTHCKVHSHATGAVGGKQDMSRTKGAQFQNSHCGGCECNPVRVIVTKGAEAD